MVISKSCLFLAIFGGMMVVSQAELSIVNPGFESGLEGWKVKTPDESAASASVIKEAAKSGDAGLRVVDESDALDVTIYQEKKFPATAGKTYEVRFQGRAPKNNKGICVFMRFFDKDGRDILKGREHRILAELDPDSPEWKEYSLSSVAPEGTTKLDVYIRTNKRGVLRADLDDFRLTEK